MAKMELECGPGSDPSRYWIADVATSKMVALGVDKEYALIMVHAVNELYGETDESEATG